MSSSTGAAILSDEAAQGFIFLYLGLENLQERWLFSLERSFSLSVEVAPVWIALLSTYPVAFHLPLIHCCEEHGSNIFLVGYHIESLAQADLNVIPWSLLFQKSRFNLKRQWSWPWFTFGKSILTVPSPLLLHVPRNLTRGLTPWFFLGPKGGWLAWSFPDHHFGLVGRWAQHLPFSRCQGPHLQGVLHGLSEMITCFQGHKFSQHPMMQPMDSYTKFLQVIPDFTLTTAGNSHHWIPPLVIETCWKNKARKTLSIWALSMPAVTVSPIPHRNRHKFSFIILLLLIWNEKLYLPLAPLESLNSASVELSQYHPYMSSPSCSAAMS